MSIAEFIKNYYPNINMSWNSNSCVMQEAVFSTKCKRDSEFVSGRFPVKKFESVIREAFTYFGYREGMNFLISRGDDNQAVQIRYKSYSPDIDTVIFDYIQFMRIALEKGKNKGKWFYDMVLI